MFLSLTGCKNLVPYMSEIEKVFVVNAVAIDKGTGVGESIKLTVASRALKGGGKEASAAEGPVVDFISAEGRTPFEAARKLNFHAHKRVFWGHLQYIVLGEEIVKNDILDLLDFFVRNSESRFYVKILVAKSAPADKILFAGNAGREFITDRLDGLLKESEYLSVTKAVKLRDAIAKLDGKLTDMCAPSIVLSQKPGQDGGNEETAVMLDGFAVFKGSRLLDFISGGTARGVNWITGDIKYCPLILKSPSGKNISVEIIDSVSKIKAVFKDNLPVVTVTVKISGNITEQQSEENIFNSSDIENLEHEQAAIVRQEAESAAAFAQANGVDIFGIGDVLYHKYPLKWDKIKGNWKTIFPDIKINVLVESKINRTYVIREPAGATGSGK